MIDARGSVGSTADSALSSAAMSRGQNLKRTLKRRLQGAGLLDFARLGVQLTSMALDVRRLPTSVAALPWFVRTWREYAALAGTAPRVIDAYPCLTDRHESAGAASGHYFHQDLWAARKVFESRVTEHVDVGSRMDGFAAHVASFTKLVYVDIRPLTVQGHPNITARTGSVLDLPFDDRSLRSLSCLHVVEHVGLGRYGDPLDPRGTLKALAELQRVVAPGGDLYLGLPVGRERVCFNAHRVHAPCTVLDAMNRLELVEFSAVNDAGDLERNTTPEQFAGADYACGLFHLHRRRG